MATIYRKIGKLKSKAPKIKKIAKKYEEIEKLKPKTPMSEFERDDLKAKPRKRR